MGEAVPPVTPVVRECDSDVPYARGPLLVRKPGSGERGVRRSARVVESAAARASSRIRQLPGRVEELRNQVAGALPSGSEIKYKTSKLSEQAARKARELRLQARHYAWQNPLETLGFAGIAGLVLGFSLRLWRDHRG